MKRIIRDYFSFTKKERIAVFALIILIIVFVFLPNFFEVKKQPVLVDEQTKQQIVAIEQSKNKRSYSKQYTNENSDYSSYNTQEKEYSNTAALFTFNPNTLDFEGWKKLGLRDKTIKTILNYTSKGGKFKTPEDIRKIWGLRKDEADRLIPYIVINNSKLVDKASTTKETVESIYFDVNTCTVEQLKKIPSIGNSLPYKIISFREKLGGFVNMAQVKETYGMTDSVFKHILQYLHFQPTEIRKLNINTATDFELNAHPYIDKTLSKAMIIYRQQHGGYQSVADIKKIVFVKQDLFNKIEPYLTVGE